MKRSKAQRIHNDYYKSKRKKDIKKHVLGYKEQDFSPKEFGKLNKGKIHCSCGMCQRFRKEVAYQKWGNLKKEGKKIIANYYKGYSVE